MRVTDDQAKNLNIVSGPTGIKFAETEIDAEEE